MVFVEEKPFIPPPVPAPKKQQCHLFYWLLDWAYILFFLSPLVIFFWRGSVEYFLGFADPLCFWLMTIVGSGIQSFFYVIRTNCVKPGPWYVIIVYVFGTSTTMQWSGVWGLLDYYSGLGYEIAAGTLIVSLLLMAMTRILRNISGPPFDFVPNDPADTFVFPTLFKTTALKQGTVETCLYILDCLFSVFVVGSLVVFVWRGAWAVIDVFLYPDNMCLSAFSSLVIGYGVVLVTFILQAPMKKLCDWLTGFWRIVAVDLYILFSFIGTINLWRGIWNLLNVYFLPNDPALSFWITHIFPFLLLVLINCSNTVLVRGVYIDGEELGGKCVDFPTYYLRMFFQEQRKKKLLKQSQRMRIKSLANKTDFEKAEEVSQEKNQVAVDLPHVTRF